MDELSEVDKAIIRFLLTTGSEAYPAEIAKRIGNSKSWTGNRCSFLENEGILQSRKRYAPGCRHGTSHYALNYSIDSFRKIGEYPDFVPLLQNNPLVLFNVALDHKWATHYNGLLETNAEFLDSLDILYDIYEDTEELRKSKEEIKEEVISFSKCEKGLNNIAFGGLLTRLQQSQSFFELFLNNDAEVLEKNASDHFRLTQNGQYYLLLRDSDSLPIEDVIKSLFDTSLLDDMLAGRRNEPLIKEITTGNKERAKSQKEACERATSLFVRHNLCMEIKEILSESIDVSSLKSNLLKITPK